MKQRMIFVMLSAAILAFLLLACLVIGQTRLVVKPGAVSRVDELLTQMTGRGSFAGSVLIAQDGEVLLSKGYGLADRNQGIPNTPQTSFHLGSLSKQFTAMGILILESQGKLSVQDPICSFIADCPQEWQGISIHHLLTHTSGLSSIQSAWRYQVIDSAPSGPVTPADQAEYLGFSLRWFQDARPGERYAYSNFGYCLLAYIIEQVSGQSYADFLSQAIFAPLGMHNTGYHGSTSDVAGVYADPTTTAAYSFGDQVISEGAGNLYATTEDLYRWDQALDTGQLLPQPEYDRMFTAFVRETHDVPGFGYGYGWLVTKILGRPVVGGAGGGPYTDMNSPYTIYLRLPGDRWTLIVFSNQAYSNGFPLLGAIASTLFLSDLIFEFTAIAFPLLLAVLLAAQRNQLGKAAQVVGILWSFLAALLALVFACFLVEGRGLGTLLPLSLVLLSMLAKVLLDFVFRIDLRRNQVIRLASQAVECLALFSLIWIAFSIHPSWGIPVLIATGMLAVSLIFTYREKPGV